MAEHIMEQGSGKLAILLGGAGRSHALARMSGLRASPGWLVTGDAIREWHFEGFAQRPEGTFLFGPEAKGPTLAEAFDLPLPDQFPLLGRLADALGALADRGIPLFPLQSDAIVFTDAGGVLFLPPGVMREIRGVQPFAENRDTFEALNHPDLRAEALASFSLGVALYRAAAGRFPFAGADEEEIHEQARKLRLLPLADLAPGFSPEASELTMAALGRLKGRAVALADWRAGLRSWVRNGITREVGAPERERLARDAVSRGQDAAKRFRTRTFWEKNWRLVAIAAAGVGVAGLIVGSIVSGIFAPRATKGFTARNVVQTFYLSVNSMNHSLMEACVVDRAGQGEINEAMNLYVMSRVQMGYEGKANTVAADQWDEAGRPALPAGIAVYGVTGLSIEEQAGEPAPVYLASYEKWAPESSAETTSLEAAAIHTLHRKLVDRVSLRRDKGDWVIFRLDRISEQTLASPESAPASPVDTTGEPAPGATAP